MIKRIEKLEDELNIIKQQLEMILSKIESDIEKTEALTTFSNSMIEFVKETNDSILDLKDSYVVSSKNRGLHFEIIESQGRVINILTETIESMNEKISSMDEKINLLTNDEF